MGALETWSTGLGGTGLVGSALGILFFVTGLSSVAVAGLFGEFLAEDMRSSGAWVVSSERSCPSTSALSLPKYRSFHC
jgi:hypothetical protein